MALLEAGPKDGAEFGFVDYRGLFDDYATASPQVQGIEDKNAHDAISGAPTTQFISDQGMVVPGLYEVEKADWLNAEHIKKEAGVSEAFVLHTSPSDGELIIGDDVKSFGGQLLRDGGAVVVSYPTSDESALDRATDNVSEIVGAQGLDYTHLGAQTYFSGEVRVVDSEAWRDQREQFAARYGGDPSTLITTAFAQQPRVDTEGGYTVSAVPRIPNDSIGPVFEFVDRAFKSVADHPCRQAWRFEEFKDIATERDSVVKVMSEHEGVAAALLAFGSRIEDYPWISEEFYRNDDQHKTKIEDGKLVYFPTVASNAEATGIGALISTIPYVAEVFAGVDELQICFDACDKNRRTLPLMISHTVKSTGVSTIQFEEIATQNYGVFTASAS